MRIRFRLLCAVLLLAFSAPARAAEPVWVQVSSPNFTVFTDTTELKGRRLLEDFEGRLAALKSVLGNIPNRQFPVEILLFSKKEDLNPYLPTRTSSEEVIELKSAYLVRGADRIFIVARDKAPEDIADDVGHALGHIYFERLGLWRPFWMAEGAAEYFRKVGRSPDTKRISEKDGFTVADLLDIVPSKDYKDDEKPTVFRAQAHRLFRLLASENNAAFREYVSALKTIDGKGAKPKVDVPALQARFDVYTETRIAPGDGMISIKVLSPAVNAGVERGDALVAMKRTSEAGEWYSADTREARISRAILSRYSRGSNEAIRTLDRASREFPDSGLVAFHLGSIVTKAPADIEIQVHALERAAELLPLLGRVRGQLARVYTLAGNGQEALMQIDRAIELEPEYADEFYEIRADALLTLARYADANKAAQMAAALPHLDATQDYKFKASEMERRVEQTRREAEGRQLQRIEAEVRAQVAEREPPPPPKPPPPPERVGSIQYTMQSTRQTSIVSAPLPTYARALIQKGSAGEITLQVTVGPDGKVTQVSIAQSQLPEMNADTIDAVKRWTFTPANAGRGPIGFDAKIVVRFTVQ
jgi:TonB family protein